ncbi:hypothetical protein CLOM_g4129 [Closterium sp. NIES-68]|nr:hypothetical protein CLOM_g4129 [Closterium sp. NIES-68]GJP62915.1 hypothetical protein CLOP_g19978 [Closterium sp. NIES-67]
MSDGNPEANNTSSASRSTAIFIGEEPTDPMDSGNPEKASRRPPSQGALSIDLDSSRLLSAAAGRRTLSIDIDSAKAASRGGGDDGADDAAFGGSAPPKTPSERLRAIMMQAATEGQDVVKAESSGKQRAAELQAKRQRSKRGGGVGGSSRRVGGTDTANNNNTSNSSAGSELDRTASYDSLSRDDDAASTGTGGGGGGGVGGELYSPVDNGYGEFVAARDDYSDYHGKESGSHGDGIHVGMHGGIHGGLHGASISPIRVGPMGPRFGGTSPGSPTNSESRLFRRGPKSYSDTGTPRSEDGRSAGAADVAEDDFGETGEGGGWQRKVGNGYIQMNGTVASGFTLLEFGGKREQYERYQGYWKRLRPETQKTALVVLLFVFSLLLTVLLTLLFTFMFVPRQHQQPPPQQPPSLQSPPVESQAAESQAQLEASPELASPVEAQAPPGAAEPSLPSSESPPESPTSSSFKPPDALVASLQVKYWATWLDDRFETSRPEMPGYLWAKLQFQLHFPSITTFLSATQSLSIDLLYLNTSLAPPDKATSYPKPSADLLPWPILDYTALNTTEADSQVVRAVWECNNCRIPGGHGAAMEEDEKDGEVLVVMRVRVDGKHLRVVGSSHVIGLNRTVSLNEIGGSRASTGQRHGMDFVFAVVPHK